MKIPVPDAPADCLDAVVIGAGQSGLAMAWHLKQQGLRFLVVDAAPVIGHSWRTRWDSLRLFSPAEYDGLPGMAFPAPAGTYPTKDEVADYLQAYASAFELPVLLDARVVSLRRVDERFLVRTSQGELRARQVVVASGAFQTPFVPELADGLEHRVVQLHSSEYRNPADLPSGQVLVVGAGNSGLQLAEELARHGRQVAVSVGTRPLALPQRILGKDLFWWMTRAGLFELSAESPLGRRLRSRGDLVIGSSHRQLRRSGVTFRPRLTAVEGRTATFADGSSYDLDAVVWATGFRPDYSWVEVPDAVPAGRPAHRRGVTAVPGLFFLGLPWQHTRGSALLGFVRHDAAWLGGVMAEHRLPVPEFTS